MSETFKFEAEINQLMHLIINAFYSNKDVFLRELISNASDALDKIKYLSLSQDMNALLSEPNMEIKIIPNSTDRYAYYLGYWYWYDKSGSYKNLGTSCCSGTKSFIENLQQAGDINLIGQFGVGFYSIYLVASKVEVYSKHNDDKCYKWESDASGTFTVSNIESTEITRGTKIVLHLKSGEEKYAEESTIREIIKKHSNYINYPILLLTTKTKENSKNNRK